MREYEVIHIMDAGPEALLRVGARRLAELHKEEDGAEGSIGWVARKVIELADQIDRDIVKKANGAT